MNNNYTYLRGVKPEFVTAVIRSGELDITIRDNEYNTTVLNLTGDDITGIARALADIKVKAAKETVNA
jgi:hypothetical protein